MALTITTSKISYRAGSQWVDGDLVFPIVTATAGATGTVNWSDGGKGGTFQGLSSTSAAYIPANKSQSVIITGLDTGAGGSGTVAIQVSGTFPLQPNLGYETQLDSDTKMARARGGTRYFREDYPQEVALSLSCERRSRPEMEAAREFWRFHRKVTPFYYLDIETGMLNLVRFESAISYKFDGAQWWSMTFAVRGDYQNTLEPAAAPTTLRINCGEFKTLNDWLSDVYFTNADSYYAGPVAVNSSGLSAPVPPDELLRYCRFDPVAVHYSIPGLKASHAYNCRLIFCFVDTSRTASVQANGVTQAPNITTAAGFVAVEKLFTVNSTALGVMAIDVTRVAGVNCLVNAIEIVE